MVGVATLFYKDTTDFSFRLLRWGPDFAIITVALESKGCFKSREFAPMRLHIQGQQRKSGWLVACSLAGYGNIIYYEVMKYRMRWISKPHHRTERRFYVLPSLCSSNSYQGNCRHTRLTIAWRTQPSFHPDQIECSAERTAMQTLSLPGHPLPHRASGWGLLGCQLSPEECLSTLQHFPGRQVPGFLTLALPRSWSLRRLTFAGGGHSLVAVISVRRYPPW